MNGEKNRFHNLLVRYKDKNKFIDAGQNSIFINEMTDFTRLPTDSLQRLVKQELFLLNDLMKGFNAYIFMYFNAYIYKQDLSKWFFYLMSHKTHSVFTKNQKYFADKNSFLYFDFVFHLTWFRGVWPAPRPTSNIWNYNFLLISKLSFVKSFLQSSHHLFWSP